MYISGGATERNENISRLSMSWYISVGCQEAILEERKREERAEVRQIPDHQEQQVSWNDDSKFDIFGSIGVSREVQQWASIIGSTEKYW